MPRILYVFPHPDDESFGPAPALAKQRREGHAVHLLTLTRGEATAQREKYGFSKEEMGAVREREMQGVAEALGLSSLRLLDLPDGGLAELDPRVLEDAVAARIRAVRPQIVATYAAHGISGHRDHLASHAAVKRVFCALRDEGTAYLKRLAFFTLPESDDPERPAHLRSSPEEKIGCVVQAEAQDVERARAALAAYETYQDVIETHRPLRQVEGGVCFELFQETLRPPLGDLFAGLEAA